MYIVNCIWPVTSNLGCLIDGQFVSSSCFVILAKGLIGVIEMHIFYTCIQRQKKYKHPGSIIK